MARKQSKAAKKRTHKRRQQRGGGWGFTGAGSAPGTPGTVSNPMVYTGIGDCRAVKPGYDIPYSQYGASFKGLPGMSGGAKRTRKGMRKNKSRKQRGGRYGFAPEMDPNTHGQAWWAGSYAPIQRIGCEGGSFNPLNPTHTGSSAPPGAANPNYWMAKGGSMAATSQRGGAQSMAPASVGPSQPTGYGVGNVDSMYYYAPTGGYANNASTWKDSVGAPVQIQVPYAARSMNQACLTTGGAPPLTGALQQGGSMAATSQRGGKRKHNKKGTRKQRGGEGVLNKIGLGGIQASLPSWLGGPGSSSSSSVATEGVELTANNVYSAVNKAGLRPPYVRERIRNAMAPSVISSSPELPPLPASPPNTPRGNGNGNGMNGNGNGNENPPLPAGGRRRKNKKSKSRKH